jgi:hypothetical protein
MIFFFIQASFSCSFPPLTATLALEVHFKSSKIFESTDIPPADCLLLSQGDISSTI